MTDSALLTRVDDQGTGWVTLNRPDIHNAFDDALIADLARAFKAMEADERVRVVVLRSEGKSFSAGADLNWMKRMAGYGFDENLADARALGAMLQTLDRLAKPTVALVQGAAFGGGVGLVAACDIVIAAEEASFALTEVKLGIIAGAISPYVVGAIGARQARRYMLTGERFMADDARRIGLVHKVVEAADLMPAGKRLLQTLAKNGPRAMAASKALVHDVARRPVDDDVMRAAAEGIARARASDEGKEGIAAFLEKRKPNWIKD